MSEAEIDKLYPRFEDWLHKTKHFACVQGIWLIKFWHEWLKERNENKSVR